MNKSMVMQF